MSRVIAHSDLQHIGELICDLAALGKTCAIYGTEHPRTLECYQKYEHTRDVVRSLPFVERDELTIACRGDRLYLENLPLPENAQIIDLFTRDLGKEWSGFVLSLALDWSELQGVLARLGFGQGGRKSGRRKVSGLQFLAPKDLERRESTSNRAARDRHLVMRVPELRIDSQMYYSAFSQLEQFMKQCATDDDADIIGMMDVTNCLADNLIESSDSVMPLTTVPYYDEFTYYHSVNVCILTLSAARLVIDSRDQLRRIGQAALLHDVGKALVPIDILYKTGPLNDKEMQAIMRHPVDGARMLQRFPEVDPLTVAAAFGHHIKDNGTGYPQVPPSFRMGPVTALLEVVDIFEALTAMRPYKRPLTATQAFEILYSMPNMTSKRCYMDLLLRAVGEHPVGSRVRTADGELGVVCGHENGDPTQPIVRLVKKDAGGGLATDQVCIGRGDSAERPIPSSDSPSDTRIVPIVAMDPEEDLEVADA